MLKFTYSSSCRVMLYTFIRETKCLYYLPRFLNTVICSTLFEVNLKSNLKLNSWSHSFANNRKQSKNNNEKCSLFDVIKRLESVDNIIVRSNFTVFWIIVNYSVLYKTFLIFYMINFKHYFNYDYVSSLIVNGFIVVSQINS